MGKCRTCIYEPACKMWGGDKTNEVCYIYNDRVSRLRVQTDNGLFDACETYDEEYPGIDIEFIPDSYDGSFTYPRVLFEYIKEEEQLRVLIWSDKYNEDYTRQIEFDLGGV